MADINTWTMAGRIASDPETRTVGDQKVTEFRIACDTSRSKEEDAALFMTCVLWGRDGIIPYLAKGKKILASGNLRQRDYVTQDGNKRSVIECVLRDIDPFFANPRDSVANGNQGNTGTPAPVPEQTPGGSSPEQDEIPFGPSLI